MGDEHIFVLGGKDSCTLSIINKCQKFNINTLKWEALPDMNHPRAAAGSFMSQDKQYLYVFGGSHDSVERLPLNRFGTWEVVTVELP